jgi:hypothetical protein
MIYNILAMLHLLDIFYVTSLMQFIHGSFVFVSYVATLANIFLIVKL